MARVRVCPFCSRSYNFEEEKGRTREEIWRRWWLFLRRYFGGTELNGGAFRDGWVESGVGFCEGCGLLVDGILEEYHQLKCVELRLGWKLECLAEIVRLGDRVKERKAGMRRTVEENLGEGKVEEVCMRVRGFRKDFLRKCSGRLARSFPRLVLDRRTVEEQIRDLRNSLGDREKIPHGLGNEYLEGVPGENGKKTRLEESSKISNRTKEIQVHLYLSADDHLNLSHYEDTNKLVKDDMVTTSSPLPVSRGSSVAGGATIGGGDEETLSNDLTMELCRKRRRSQIGLDLSEEGVDSQRQADNQPVELLQTSEETNVEQETVNPTSTTLDTTNWQCQCKVCSDWFRSASILKLHRKLKHGDSSQNSVTTTVDETDEDRQSEPLEISTSSPSPKASFQVKTEEIMDAEEHEDHEDSRSPSEFCELPSPITFPCASPSSSSQENFDNTESTAANQDGPKPINKNTAMKITLISQEQTPAGKEPIRNMQAIPINGEIVNELSTLSSAPSSLSPSKPKAPKVEVEDTADSEENSTDQQNTTPYNLRRSSRKTVTKYVKEDVSDDDDDVHDQTDANSQQDTETSSDSDSDFEPSFKEIKEEMEIETDTRIKCPICGKQLKCAAGLEVHMGIMHKNSPTVSSSNYQSLKCSLCTTSKRTFLTINRLKMHFKWRHPSNNLSFERLSSLESLPNPTVKCELCEKLFFTRKDLRGHTRSCLKNLHGQFSCKFCSKQETFAPDLSRHELQHSKRNAGAIGLPFFYCPRCPFKVLHNENAYINHHLAMHVGIAKDKTRLWHCPICQLTRADFKKVKKQHFARFHDLQGVNPESVKWCEEKGCSAYFLRKHQLDAHRRLVHYVSEEVSEEGDDEDVGETEEMEVHEKETHGKEVRKKQVQERESCSEPTFECKLCFKHFRHEKLLEQHMKMLHLANKYRIRKKPIFCSEPDCNEKFSDKNCLQAHKLLHGHWKCGFCSVEKDYAPDIAVHEADHGVRTFHEEKEETSTEKPTEKISQKYRRFNCPRCIYFGNSRTLYVRHFVEKHLKISTKTHTCTICNAKVRGNSVAFHFETHHNTDGVPPEDIQRCDQCPAYFLFGMQLLRHKTEMHFDSNSKCPVCGGGPYKDRKSYFQHYNKYHDKSQDPSLPEVCNAKNCGKRFATKPELEWHLTFGHRLNDKPNDGWVDCKLCHKRFWKQQGLKKHMKHSHPKEPKKKEKKFVCELCGKAFSRKVGLQMHMVYHQDPETWKYECEICKKKCADKYKLQAHMQTHNTTDKVAYQCEHCGQSYAHRHNWRNHVKDKHGIVIPIARGHSLSGPRSVVKERVLMKQ